MAEDKRANPYPYPTAEDVRNAPGDRTIKAARNIISRRIDGIPKRAYVTGENDHAIILQGIHDLTTVCYKLIDAIDNTAPLHGDSPLPDAVIDANAELVAMLEDHRCPEPTATGAD